MGTPHDGLLDSRDLFRRRTWVRGNLHELEVGMRVAAGRQDEVCEPLAQPVIRGNKGHGRAVGEGEGLLELRNLLFGKLVSPAITRGGKVR